MTAPRLPKSRPRKGRYFSALVCGVVLATAGCGGGTSPCAVTGKVLVDGQPAEGVYVVFHTAGGTGGQHDSASARSGSDGSFSLVVSAPGESVVTAFWPTVTVKGVETIEGPDRLRGIHRDPSRPVAKATIQAGENTLPPISMTSPGPAKTRTRGRR